MTMELVGGRAHYERVIAAVTNAKVSVFDHGLLYGDGIFEGIRAYNGRVFKLREHLVSPEGPGHIAIEATRRCSRRSRRGSPWREGKNENRKDW